MQRRKGGLQKVPVYVTKLRIQVDSVFPCQFATFTAWWRQLRPPPNCDHPGSPHGTGTVSPEAPGTNQPTSASVGSSATRHSTFHNFKFGRHLDWDVCADPVFVSNGGSGTAQDLARDTEPSGGANLENAFQSNRRRADDPTWSLPSTRPANEFDLDDNGILSMPPQVSREHQQLQHQADQEANHIWDLDMDLGTVDSQLQRPPSEAYSHGSGPGTENDPNLTSRNNAMMLPSPDTTSGSNSTYAETSQGSLELKKSTSSQRPCKCLRIMAQALQTVDAQGAGTDTDTKKVGIDMLVILLGRGMETLEEVLACDQCNVCVENGIIVATLAQQLMFVSETAARKLVAHMIQSAMRCLME
ncbi:hypothetical protein N7541_010953 [Penicillium brevicompactum]|uniref:Uncharacterized protein n=1 Tax=Penicillium brevicompactum TaxID=5074 RepID=A0A9W9QRU6_PENBR|nr:hypothetical protein N7541_010953 [Penicillium brevicompactum]